MFAGAMPTKELVEMTEESTAAVEEREAQDAEEQHESTSVSKGKGDKDEALARLAKQRDAEREKARTLEAELESIRAKQREADEAKAKEEGKFKELLEQREKELNELKSSLAERELNDLKRSIAAEEGLPGDLALRLVGTDDETLRKDAKALAKHLKAQESADTDAGERTKPGLKRPDKSEFANPARWGLRH